MVPGAPQLPLERAALIVFARAPEPGRVKTRLAAAIGDARALEIYRDLGSRTIAALRDVIDSTAGAGIVVYHTPGGTRAMVASWLGADLTYREQHGDTLGERMMHAIETELANGAGRVVIVGTDCPELDGDLVRQAISRLDEVDVVLGPASDGGYYLLAVKAGHPELFEDIPWSTPMTLSATLAAAQRARLTVSTLGVRSDIDTEQDWRDWKDRSARLGAMASGGT